jgi:FkbM family methyltransferase
MNIKLASFKLRGLFSYLVTRTKLRFLDKKSSEPIRKTVVILGKKVELDLMDLEQKYLAADCVREPENLIVYRAIADSGLVDTFIDVGANCGHVAVSVLSNYKQVLLFEPNPKLAKLLRDIFGTQSNIAIRECAIVDETSVGKLTLTVPDDSSGLATLGSTDLSKKHDQVHSYDVRTSTLASEVKGFSVGSAYIKIDVEGFELNIINSAKALINTERPIVGFEALSNEAALNCAKIFEDYVFYCARFDFLENGGALSRSFPGIMKAMITGAQIEVLRIQNVRDSNLNNFSQIYSVPREKSEEFEKSILSYVSANPIFDFKNLKTWS